MSAIIYWFMDSIYIRLSITFILYKYVYRAIIYEYNKIRSIILNINKYEVIYLFY